MTNKEAFDIVLKMAKDRNMTGYDIMYDGQEAEVEREREALNQMEDYNMEEDKITYFEMARIAMAIIPDDLAAHMDMSDDEFVRLREQLQQHMNN